MLMLSRALTLGALGWAGLLTLMLAKRSAVKCFAPSLAFWLQPLSFYAR